MKKLPKPGLKKNSKLNICVIGVGYVGLPLATNLSKFFSVLAYDKDYSRIRELQKGYDRNLEYNSIKLKNKKLKFTNNFRDINKSNVYIVTLPTPLYKNKTPDISLVVNLTKNLAKIIKKNDLIVYESTFYPGTINDELIPILEKISKLSYKKDFFVGYSPERINPGDKVHTIENVKKIIASDNEITKKMLIKIYSKIVKAGVYQASSIKVAELSKILENTQRFLNIALINQISSLCNALNIQTKEVIDVASTKWNFMKFNPGFVGGHCVAVDPLYLTYKQKSLGLSSTLIEEADKINSKKHIEVLKIIKNHSNNLHKKKILILGATFKENCPDLRNSGVLDLIASLNKNKNIPFLHDPYLDKDTLGQNDNINFRYLKKLTTSDFDCIIVAVGHDFYKKLGIVKIKRITNKKKCLFLDLKSLFNKQMTDFQL